MQSNQIQLTGVLTGTPANTGYFSASLVDLLQLNFCDCYACLVNRVESEIVSSSGSPFALPFGTMTKARVVAIRLLAGVTINVTITTTAKGAATFPVSDLYVHRVRNPGDEILSITIDTSSQACDVAYLLAGDVS